MSRPDWPRTGCTVAFGLEIQMLGTPAELDAATTALARIGRVAWDGIGQPRQRVPLAGADAGRWRAYLLLHLPTQPAPAPAEEVRHA
jgi:hypothetical protein